MSANSAWAGGLVTLALAAGGCGEDGDTSKSTSSPTPAAGTTPKESTTVSIADFKFVPKSITVPAGTKVTWTNEDAAPHTATAGGDGSFDTGTLNKGESKTITLAKAGTYSYICEFHAFMTATVTVR